MRSERGVTLIEMVLTIVLLGIIGIITAEVFLYSTRSVLTGDAVREATQVNRLAVDRMIREIRNVRNNTSVITANATTFEFINIDGDTVKFDLAGTDLNRVFTDPPSAAVTNKLATNVSGLAFTYLDNTGTAIGGAPIVTPAATNIWSVQIALTVGSGAEAVQFRSQVHPRGF